MGEAGEEEAILDKAENQSFAAQFPVKEARQTKEILRWGKGNAYAGSDRQNSFWITFLVLIPKFFQKRIKVTLASGELRPAEKVRKITEEKPHPSTTNHVKRKWLISPYHPQPR